MTHDKLIVKQEKPTDSELFYLKVRGSDAEATYSKEDKRMIVLEGSRRTPKPTSASFSKYELLDELIEVGVIDKPGLVFLKDYTFKSPSEAAEIIAGSPYDGPREWKDKDGQSLEESQASK
ncbi:DUF4357 domain-containing protein [Streptococcaceae bacterium ESL0729]|nr:DUF4357 domain-containing protein [Streptococcaceae bacterium ESL0729]